MEHEPSLPPDMSPDPYTFDDILGFVTAKNEDGTQRHLYTSPGFISENFGLSQEQSQEIINEMIQQGYVGQRSDKAKEYTAYEVYSEKIDSAGLTKKRRFMTGKIGRAVVQPLTKHPTEVVFHGQLTHPVTKLVKKLKQG